MNEIGEFISSDPFIGSKNYEQHIKELFDSCLQNFRQEWSLLKQKKMEQFNQDVIIRQQKFKVKELVDQITPLVLECTKKKLALQQFILDIENIESKLSSDVQMVYNKMMDFNTQLPQHDRMLFPIDIFQDNEVSISTEQQKPHFNQTEEKKTKQKKIKHKLEFGETTTSTFQEEIELWTNC